VGVVNCGDRLAIDAASGLFTSIIVFRRQAGNADQNVNAVDKSVKTAMAANTSRE
jgi:hypothetical protein